MPLEKCEAVVLKAFNWSESSRTVVFFSKRFGKLPLVDKGGRSIKSKRGRVIPFTRLEISFFQTEKESSGYLSDCEVLEMFSLEGEGSLGRLAYGSAASELLYFLLPEGEEQPELYGCLLLFFSHLSKVERSGLPSLFIAFLLRAMSLLGYHLSLAFCPACNKPSDSEDMKIFSPERGGILCPSCQIAGEYYIPLSADELKQLCWLQTASMEEAGNYQIGFQAATLLIDLLIKFLKYNSGLKSDLKSLEFLDKLKRSDHY